MRTFAGVCFATGRAFVATVLTFLGAVFFAGTVLTAAFFKGVAFVAAFVFLTGDFTNFLTGLPAVFLTAAFVVLTGATAFLTVFLTAFFTEVLGVDGINLFCSK
ncbi:hypothetical protein [Parasegetibacter sp. NRK P23]|uniref:hypothetical protein n=1 Tax=Parasegetibacter sp. NRK P23 TaxID=2942999 RepID=UPI0020443CC5|nr:hypothetical protein [Parasegetibacter sp. NRK P23]MCM5528868.1 hypothetical protein [Parasegetibacter sp. NRK P23]